MSKKILFMGTPDYATKIFEEIIDNKFEVVGLFTQPDKPVGRKQLLTPPHIKQFCLDKNLDIPIFQPNKLRNNNEIKQQIIELNPDIIVVAAYGQILPIEILNIAPCINLHASLLPYYRGASPIQESLINDDNYTGVTAMMMEEGLDTGDILGFKYLKITNTMKVDEAFDKLSIIAAKLTINILNRFEQIKPKKQNDSLSSLCKKIKKEHGLVNFISAQNLYLKYKAYSYWPGVFLNSGLKLKDISLNEKISENRPGEILELNKDNIIIGCLNGSLRIKTIQSPSKKATSAVDYIRGQRLSLGELLQ
mgnify:CR=1 FL=1